MVRGIAQHELRCEAVLRSIDNLAPNASMSIRKEAGTSTKSSLNYTWIFDNRNISRSGIGVYLKSANELSSHILGGDSSFFKTTFESQFLRKISSNASLSFGLRAGFLYPLDLDSRISLADRFFLGGASDVRIFRERGLGPHDGMDALGGELMWASGISLSGDIPCKGHWPVKWQVFMNAGRLGHHRTDEPLPSQLKSALSNPSVSTGVGLIYNFDFMRIELNLGVPLAQSRGEKSRRGLQLGVGLEFL